MNRRIRGERRHDVAHDGVKRRVLLRVVEGPAGDIRKRRVGSDASQSEQILAASLACRRARRRPAKRITLEIEKKIARSWLRQPREAEIGSDRQQLERGMIRFAL